MYRFLVQLVPKSIKPSRQPPLRRQSHPSARRFRAVDSSLNISLGRTPDFRDVPLQCPNPERSTDRTHRSKCLRGSWNNS